MDTAQPEASSPAADPIDLLVGRRVHTLMWDQRVKNKELGAILDIDPTAVGKKLRAEQKFSIEQLVDVARRLRTTVAYLVGETDNPARPSDEGVGRTGLEPVTDGL